MNMNFNLSALFHMTMLNRILLQANLILTKYLVAKYCAILRCLSVIVLSCMITGLTHKSMRMTSRVKNKKHYNIDNQTSYSNNQHRNGLLHKLLLDYPESGLIYEKYCKDPNDEKIP